MSSAALFQQRAAKVSKVRAMRAKPNNDVGPLRTPGNNDFWRPTTAKLPGISWDLGLPAISPVGLSWETPRDPELVPTGVPMELHAIYRDALSH